jgi:hypothetical protein
MTVSHFGILIDERPATLTDAQLQLKKLRDRESASHPIQYTGWQMPLNFRARIAIYACMPFAQQCWLLGTAVANSPL